jgi:large subunit ribosomal protein L6
MSRIGKQPIDLPKGVDVNIDGQDVVVKGPKGELSRTISDVVSIRLDDGTLYIERPDDSRQARSHQGLVRSLVANMVEGVSEGFTRELEINGVGYRAEALGRFIRFDLGYSHPIFLELPEGVDAEVQQTSVKLLSADKELVGQVAAKIRSLRKPEPYKGKGIKYKEERIVRKVGKAGA